MECERSSPSCHGRVETSEFFLRASRTDLLEGGGGGGGGGGGEEGDRAFVSPNN